MKKDRVSKYVRHSNEICISLANYSKCEMDLLMIIFAAVRDIYTEDVVLTYGFLRDTAGFGPVSNRRMFDMLEKTNAKTEAAIARRFSVNSNGKRSSIKMAIFPVFEQSEATALLRIAVNPEFTYLFNELNEGGWTSFELEEFLKLKSKYSKRLYRHLKIWKTVGKVTLSMEDIRDIIGLPTSYEPKTIGSKMKSFVKELDPLFKDLKLRTMEVSNHGKGRSSVIGYTITFTPEKANIPKEEENEKEMMLRNGGTPSGMRCPSCGRRLMEKVINGNNCWCHYDYISGECNRIWNSAAEIHEAWRLKKEENDHAVMTPEQEENKKRIANMIKERWG